MGLIRFLFALSLVVIMAGCFPGNPVKWGGGTPVPELPSPPDTSVIHSVSPLSDELPTEPSPPPSSRNFDADITHWEREVLVPGQTERITLTIRNLYDAAWFYVVFGGYYPYEEPINAWISDAFFMPKDWEGTLVFDVPLNGFHRILWAQIWMGESEVDPYFNVREMEFFIPPCPTEYAWPEGTSYEWCEATYGQP